MLNTDNSNQFFPILAHVWPLVIHFTLLFILHEIDKVSYTFRK